MDNKIGSGDKVLDWVMILAALVMFIKTADVLGYFAPVALNGIFGFDVGYLYGAVNALFVEATMLALHFNRKAHSYTPAKIAKWILLAISAVCQVFDGFIATNTLAQQSDELKFLFQYGVPSITTLVIIMILAIGKLPDDGKTAAHVGLKNRLPNWNRIWNGDEVTVPEQEEVIDDGDNNGNGQKRQKGRENWQTISRKFTREDYLQIAGASAEDTATTYNIPLRTAYHWQKYAKNYLSRNKR